MVSDICVPSAGLCIEDVRRCGRVSGARFHLQDDVRMGVHMGVHMGVIGTAIAESSLAAARPPRL
jgi:hypothetical protein